MDGEVAVPGPSGESKVAKPKPDDVSIGKFDILATCAYAEALLGGHSESEAKERGMVAAIMGPRRARVTVTITEPRRLSQ